MSSSVFNKVTEQLISTGAIKAEDKELYTYGLHQGIIIIMNIITTLVIGYLYQMLWHSILFMIFYLPLRSYAGGYHAKTQLKCYLYSILLTLSVLSIIKYIAWTNIAMLGGALASGIIIYSYAPVEDSNKPLDNIEIKVYKNRTRLILLIEMCIMILFLLFGIDIVPVCIFVSSLALSIMILLGKVRNYYELRQRYC